MVRRADPHPEEAQNILRAVPPEVLRPPRITPPPLRECKIALLTSSAIHRRRERVFYESVIEV